MDFVDDGRDRRRHGMGGAVHSSLTLVTAPSVLPVTEAEVWEHLRVPLVGSPAAPTDEATILSMIKAVVSELDGRDGWLGRCLVTQTWDMALDCFPACDRPIYLPIPPIQSITSITYVDTAGDEQTLAAGSTTGGWELSHDKAWVPRINLKYGMTWPTTRDQPEAVTVRFVAGYSPSEDSPADYRANVPAAI